MKTSDKQRKLVIYKKELSFQMNSKEAQTKSTISAPSFQPGQTWVVLDDSEGSTNITVPFGFGENNIDHAWYNLTGFNWYYIFDRV